MATDVNLNTAQCIEKMTEWGSTSVHNICTGAHTSVPWGTLDYVAVILAIAFALAIILMFLGMAKTVFFD